MKLKVYHYVHCTSCRKAFQFLDAHGISYEAVQIRQTPPTKVEIHRMLRACNGEVKRLFNTASKEYKRLKLKDHVRGMSDADVVDLLASNGNLIRRPFVIGDEICLVGFVREIWETKLLD